MREKYSNKSPLKRFLHKYTGVIILSIILTIVGSFWAYNEVNKVFFENWSCQQIYDMITDNLNDIEVIRYNEIILECTLLPFTGDP